MNKKKYTIEHVSGKQVSLTEENLFLEDCDNMLELEEWEASLEKHNVEYVTVFRKERRKIKYSIFANYRKKGSPFKV